MIEKHPGDMKVVGCDMDGEIIELHALGRIQDAELLAHLNTCEDCRARVREYRGYLEALKQALRECVR